MGAFGPWGKGGNSRLLKSGIPDRHSVPTQPGMASTMSWPWVNQIIILSTFLIFWSFQNYEIRPYSCLDFDVIFNQTDGQNKAVSLIWEFYKCPRVMLKNSMPAFLCSCLCKCGHSHFFRPCFLAGSVGSVWFHLPVCRSRWPGPTCGLSRPRTASCRACRARCRRRTRKSHC